MLVVFNFLCLIAISGARILESEPVNQEKVKCVKYNKSAKSVSNEYCEAKIEDREDDVKQLEFFCHTVWTNETGGDHPSGLVVLSQDCISNLGDAHNICRNKTSCVDKSFGRNSQQDSGRILHCCCSGNLCNQEFFWRPEETPKNSTEETIEPAPPQLSTWFLLLYTLVPLFVVSVIAAAGCYVYHHRKHAQFNSLSTLGDDAPAAPPTPTLTHRPVQLLEIKARGRFGAVWKGQLAKDMVAVKIFPLQDKQSWFAEQEIYNLPQMNHENILKFMGVDKRGENLQVEFWLVTSFHEHGSLCDFLKNNIIDWDDLVKISLSMARGLAHLHGEISSNKGSGIKPAIAHRDFKSKNVLIRSDMTACIGDFGLALQFRPNEVVGDTHGQVGTRRYMAPEVLEGAINFSRDAFLRIDMYACGLVLWEIATRCTVVETPSDYKLPFEAEASPHPSLEEISDLVVTKKVRPEFRKAWRGHPALSILCETIEECWDHDAEARLSSSCVVERLQHMKMSGPGGQGHLGPTQEYINNQINLSNIQPPSTEQVLLIPMNQNSTDVTYEDSSSLG
eukprot:GFUD01017585.1.p1 GENE.GFUD01017585.1~~GFUD01017585.1.p1  ORF type:complete len:563 (+),score=139.63 GFUD01017585.1:290-1978(+)